VGGEMVAATRVPHRGQKTSFPGRTGLPQEAQTARDMIGSGAWPATRPPHFAQKGSDGSTAVPQVGQGALPGSIFESGEIAGAGRAGAVDAGPPATAGVAETRVGGTPNFALGS
jgi:hypothetical protein